MSNEIETIVDVDENLWLKRSHVGKYIGIKDMKHNFKDFPSHYTRLRSSIRGLNECEMSTRNAIKPGRKDQKNEWDIFLSKRGLLCVINKCRKPTHNLKILADFAEVELQKNKWLCKEQESILNIMTAFKG